MVYTLENDTLHIEVESFGAELKVVRRKADNRDYMWYADKKYWGRTSPVLFPFVGSLKNKEYKLDGKAYPMGQHGFARDMEQTLISQTEDTVWFELKSNEDTMSKYPFAFILNIGYRLTDNKVEVMWKVTNPDEKKLYFSIGAHPAFLIPEDKSGYALGFGKAKEIHHHGNTLDTGLAVMDEDLVLTPQNGKVEITPEFFDRCTIMVEGKQTDEVSIFDPEGKAYVTVKFDAPLFAIWSPEGKKAPFLCIEPWYGRCDATDFDGELAERDYTNCLAGKKVFEAGYEMIFD